MIDITIEYLSPQKEGKSGELRPGLYEMVTDRRIT